MTCHSKDSDVTWYNERKKKNNFPNIFLFCSICIPGAPLPPSHMIQHWWFSLQVNSGCSWPDDSIDFSMKMQPKNCKTSLNFKMFQNQNCHRGTQILHGYLLIRILRLKNKWHSSFKCGKFTRIAKFVFPFCSLESYCKMPEYHYLWQGLFDASFQFWSSRCK